MDEEEGKLKEEELQKKKSIKRRKSKFIGCLKERR